MKIKSYKIIGPKTLAALSENDEQHRGRGRLSAPQGAFVFNPTYVLLYGPYRKQYCCGAQRGAQRGA